MHNDSSKASHSGWKRKAVSPAFENSSNCRYLRDRCWRRSAWRARMSVDTDVTHTVAHTVNRLVIDTDTEFDDVLERYESLFPTVDFAKLTRLVLSGGDLRRARRRHGGVQHDQGPVEDPQHDTGSADQPAGA